MSDPERHVMRFDHDPLPSGVPRGPWAPHPFVGAGLFFADPVTASLRLAATGHAARPVSGRSPSVVVGFGAEVVRELLTDEATWVRPPGGLIVAPPGNGRVRRVMAAMILMQGEPQKTRRRILVPPMHRAESLAAYGAVMAQVATERMDGWRMDSTVDMGEELIQIALQVQLRCLLGLQDTDHAQRIAGLVARVSDALLRPETGATQWLSRTLLGGRPIPGTPYARWVADAEALHDELLAIVRARRAAPSGRDVLSALIASVDPETGAALTDEELVGEVMGLYAAGYETTARAMLWTTFLLATHPTVAHQVRDESRALLGGRAATAEQVRAGALPRLNEAILESMRLLPPAATSIPRVAAHPTRLGGLFLPEGAAVFVCPAVEHRDASTYPAPNAFRPERWRETAPSQLAYKYIPFGAGPRRCVGAMIADVQVRVVLSLLVQRVACELVDRRVDYRTTQIVMGPAGPVGMRLSPAARGWAQSRVDHRSTARRLVDLPVA